MGTMNAAIAPSSDLIQQLKMFTLGQTYSVTVNTY